MLASDFTREVKRAWKERRKLLLPTRNSSEKDLIILPFKHPKDLKGRQNLMLSYSIRFKTK